MDDAALEDVSLDDARDRFCAAVHPLASIDRPLGTAHGYALARALAAPISLPPFANSAMDGYAVRAVDGTGLAGQPLRLTIVGEAAAGHGFTGPLRPGEAARISTGAPLPAGADSVVPTEEAAEMNGEVILMAPVSPWRHVRAAGEDLAAGALALPAGCTLGAAELALLAALGYAAVPVVRQPRVAVITVGDELRWPGESLDGGAVYNANGFALSAQVREAGGEPLAPEAAADRPEAIEEALACASRADLILTSAGVCAGRHDHVGASIARRGRYTALSLRLRPAHHVGLGVLDGVPVFALPGNPGASLIAFELLVRPALRHMAGHARRQRPELVARLAVPVASRSNTAQAFWVQLETEAGDTWALPAERQGAGMLSAAATADGVLIVPEGVADLPAGSTVHVTLLDP